MLSGPYTLDNHYRELAPEIERNRIDLVIPICLISTNNHNYLKKKDDAVNKSYDRKL